MDLSDDGQVRLARREAVCVARLDGAFGHPAALQVLLRAGADASSLPAATARPPGPEITAEHAAPDAEPRGGPAASPLATPARVGSTDGEDLSLSAHTARPPGSRQDVVMTPRDDNAENPGAARFWSTQGVEGTSTEKKVIAALLLTSPRTDDVEKWVKEVLKDVQTAPGQGWKAPPSWRRSRRFVPALFRDLLSGLKADARLAVANFAGVSATHVRTYVSDLLATKPREPLLGPGGPSLNRGAVARHVFLAHAVATLIKAHEKDWRLALEKASTPAPTTKQKRRRLSDVSRALNDAEENLELKKAEHDREMAKAVEAARAEERAVAARELERMRREIERKHELEVESLAKSMSATAIREARRELLAERQKVKKLRDELLEDLWVPGRASTRGMPFTPKTRLLIQRLLSENVPPAAVPEVMSAVAEAILESFPERLRGMKLPNPDFCRNQRTEAGALNEVVVAAALAGAKRFVSIGADDSPVDGVEVNGTVARLEDEDGEFIDWTLAAEPIADKTAKAEASFIKEQVVDRLAAAAERLRDELEERYGPTAAALLDPKECRFSRLAGGVAISDNASAAIATSRELGHLVQAAVVEELGREVVMMMTPDELDSATEMFIGTCERHLVNTLLDGAIKAEVEFLTTRHADDLAKLPKDLRATLDVSALCRAVAKAYGTGDGLYAKGLSQIDWRPFLDSMTSGKEMLAFKRTDKGHRQDNQTDAARIIWWMRKEIVECASLNRDLGDHMLRQHVSTHLQSTIIVATLYARAILDDKFTQPSVFFAASEELKWSLLDMPEFYTCVRKACEIPTDEWESTWLKEEWDIFEDIDEPAYDRWKLSYLKRKACAAQRAELYDPKCAVNVKALPLAVEILRAHLRGMLHTIRSGQAMRRLDNGDLAKPSDAAREAFKDAPRTTNRCESLFGTGKQYMSNFANVSMRSGFDIALNQHNQLHAKTAGKYVARRRRLGHQKAQEPRDGRLAQLDPRILAAAVVTARKGALDRRRDFAQKLVGFRESQLQKALAAQRKKDEAEGRKMIAAVDAYQTTPVIPDDQVSRVTKRRVENAIDAALGGLSSAVKRHEYLRAQLERISSGMGHPDLRPKHWTSGKDESIGAKVPRGVELSFDCGLLDAIDDMSARDTTDWSLHRAHRRTSPT